jgi:hypothetical protein
MNCKKIIIPVLFFIVSTHAFAQLKWPAITKQTKPWTRWWWEGSAVNAKDLTWNLEQFKKAGLGGVEVTPIYGIHGYENEFIKFLSHKWVNMLSHTLKESKRLGMGVDLANATGWPFGGPMVSDEDASKTIYYKTYQLKEGEKLEAAIEYFQLALVRTANNKQVSVDTLRKPVTANQDLQSLALDQIVYPENLPLQLLMAYSDKGDAIDLTSNVNKAGVLNWLTPPGNWKLVALFTGLHGKMVERAAPGGEGYALDHFSPGAVHRYFKTFDSAFRGHDISGLRGFFNDSYEVDDARGQANWTPDLLREFEKRRGYSLKEYLPALFQLDSAEKNSRVIYDYRATIDELLLDHFTKQWKTWGASHHAIVRNQSHGSPANTLDLYSAVDIPETEGNDILRFKFATSAAHVTGKKLVSSESATWLNEHFLSSWGDVKKAIDLYFLGGVNHIFYHGSAYSPKDAPWPGWLFYAAVHFQPVNPQWKDFHALNEYITRVQSFLQAGKPANDVLLYYPLPDRYSEPGRELLQHFDGMERNFEGTAFEKVSKWMLDNGYGFDFFSDRQLQHFQACAGKIITGGNIYKTILLPSNKLMDENSFRKIVSLAKSGATVLVYHQLPGDVPGLSALTQRRSLFNELIKSLHFTKDKEVRTALTGKGKFIVGDDMETLMHFANVSSPVSPDTHLSVVTRTNADGRTYFICNRTEKEISRWVQFNVTARSAAIFDPASGKSGKAAWRKTSKGIEAWISLQPFESFIMRTYNQPITGTSFIYKQKQSAGETITGTWKVEFLNGVPVLPANYTSATLASWTERNDSNAKSFSGTARFSTGFKKPAGSAKTWLLDLGIVHETAEVFLNGNRIATLIGPTFQTTLDAYQLKENNQLVVVVANLMANRIAWMDRNHLPWKIFYNTNMPARKKENSKNGLFDASEWQTVPSGLSGPVTITPVKSTNE